MSKTINVDTKTFVKFWLVILGLVLATWFLIRARTGLLVVGTAIFLAIAIRPLAEKLQGLFSKKVKRNTTLSSTLAFILVLLVLLLIVAVIGPVVVSETIKFIHQVPTMFENLLGGWDGINKFGQNFGVENLQSEIMKGVNDFASGFTTNIFASVGSVFSILAAGGLTLVLTLFCLLEGPKIVDSFWNALSGKKKDESVMESRRVVSRMSKVISTYVSKQVSVALLDGFVTALATLILALIFGFSTSLAFPMGLITMIFYLIPMFGQIIGCVLVSLILVFSSPVAGLIFAVFYIIYAQIENNAIAPKIQGDAMKLSPLIILAAITIGTYMFGLLGAIISIPIAGCVKVLIEEYPKMKELREKADK